MTISIFNPSIYHNPNNFTTAMHVSKNPPTTHDINLLRQQIISRHDINRQYKQNVALIYDTLTDLVDFSNQLGDKVQSLLQHQSVGFFNAYRSHLTTIQQNVAQLESKISSQEEKIKQYESEGTIALLLKKITKLEKELSNLYEIRVKLMSQLQEERIRNEVLKTENVKLGENIQDLLRRVAPQKWNIKSQMGDNLKSQELSVERKQSRKRMVFSTQIKDNKSVSLKDKRLSFNDAFVKDFADIEVKNLKNKITYLTKEHNKLLKSNVEIGQLHSELQGFFLECVQSVKKEICIRKQVPTCKLTDFKKEDKMRMLNLVLENDEIVRTIYNKLFKDPNYNNKRGLYSEPSIEIQDISLKNHKGTSLSKHKVQSKSTALPNLKNKTLKNIGEAMQLH